MLKLKQQIDNQFVPDMVVEGVIVAVEEVDLEGEVEAGNEVAIITILIKFHPILVTSNLRPIIIALKNGIHSIGNNSRQSSN